MTKPILTKQISPFDPAAISSETAQFLAKLEETLRDVPPTHTVPPAVTRAARAEGHGLFPSAGPLEGSVWTDIASAPGGPGRVRISNPPKEPVRGTYVHIHGGGWTLGAPDEHDAYNQKLARETGLRVVSVQYRLAPEHPWPACGEDCMAAARWVLENEPAPVFIGGESGGAHLTLLTALGLIGAGLGDRLAGLVLNYGMYDLRLSPSARSWGPRNLILSTPMLEWFLDNLSPDHAIRDSPELSPLLADLHALPPVLLQVGTQDPLMDDTLFLHARLRAAGVAASLAVYPGGVHAFDMFDLTIARESHERKAAFLNATLSDLDGVGRAH